MASPTTSWRMLAPKALPHDPQRDSTLTKAVQANGPRRLFEPLAHRAIDLGGRNANGQTTLELRSRLGGNLHTSVLSPK